MRSKNWRFILVGLALNRGRGRIFRRNARDVAAIQRSRGVDATLGEIYGFVCALGLILIILGFLGKRL
jgi:hypothetical protein